MSLWKSFQSACLSTRRLSNRLLPRGLEEFFENGVSLPKDKIITGRSWRATELRLKSFSDLHKLWYVNLKERNMLATQRAEAKRAGFTKEQFSNLHRVVKVKKNMARILTVLTERRIQWELAKKGLQKQSENVSLENPPSEKLSEPITN